MAAMLGSFPLDEIDCRGVCDIGDRDSTRLALES
jgi:hypothetical protein